MPIGHPEHDLLFARDFPPMDGGMARHMEALARGYPAASLTVSTGTIDGSDASDALLPQRIDRIPVRVDRLRTLGGLLAWSRRAVVLARAPGARFAWCDTIRPAGYAAYWASRRTLLPYGIMVVGNDVLNLRARIARSSFKQQTMRSILGRAAVFVANSNWTATQCRALLGELQLSHAAERVRIVPLGTDPDRFRRDAAAASEFRRRRRLPDGRWLVTVARLVDYKGIDTGIRLLSELRDDYRDLHYAIIGRGPHEGALRALAVELGVADRVHLLTDVSDAELPAAYSVAAIYLGLTRETRLDVEGFGISLAEAAACGVPAIAARGGGIPDAVVDGDTGILVDSDDLPAIAAAVRELLVNASHARRLGVAGRERVERYLNWDRVSTEMRAIAAQFGRTKPGVR